MLTITPNSAPVILPVTGGDFPGDVGQPESGETWDIFYCPSGAQNLAGDHASDQQTRGCSVTYDPVGNTLSVVMPDLATIQGIRPDANYGTWEVCFDTQPGVHHVNGAGRSAFFTFAATQPVDPSIPVPTLSALGVLVGNAPQIRLNGH